MIHTIIFRALEPPYFVYDKIESFPTDAEYVYLDTIEENYMGYMLVTNNDVLAVSGCNDCTIYVSYLRDEFLGATDRYFLEV